MGFFIKISCVFALGCSFGWVIEVIFRRFCRSGNPEGRWINPGYLKGPWLPVYGCGLCILYLLASLEHHLNVGGWLGRTILIVIMGISLTAAEYLAGVMSLRLLKVKLWDYSGEWGNLQGIICPKFAFFWTMISAAYLLFIHRYVLVLLDWLTSHAAFSILIGLYLGCFATDLIGLDLSRRGRKSGK